MVLCHVLWITDWGRNGLRNMQDTMPTDLALWKQPIGTENLPFKPIKQKAVKTTSKNKIESPAETENVYPSDSEFKPKAIKKENAWSKWKTTTWKPRDLSKKKGLDEVSVSVRMEDLCWNPNKNS